MSSAIQRSALSSARKNAWLAARAGGPGASSSRVGTEDGGQRVEQAARQATCVELAAFELLEVLGRAPLVLEVEDDDQAACHVSHLQPSPLAQGP